MKQKFKMMMYFAVVALMGLFTVSMTSDNTDLVMGNNSATQVYYTSNFLDLYWGNIIFSPILTGQRVKNEVTKTSANNSSSYTKYDYQLREYIDLTGVVINRNNYSSDESYWNAYNHNSASYLNNMTISTSTSISATLKGTLGDEIAKLGAELGVSVTQTESETRQISFNICPGQIKALYSYKVEAKLFSAKHKQTVQTRCLWWWNDGNSSTSSGTVTTYGSGYDIIVVK